MIYFQNNSENHEIQGENSSQSNTKGKINQNNQRSQLEGSKKGKKEVIPRSKGYKADKEHSKSQTTTESEEK